jgi:hypothetical protein
VLTWLACLPSSRIDHHTQHYHWYHRHNIVVIVPMLDAAQATFAPGESVSLLRCALASIISIQYLMNHHPLAQTHTHPRCTHPTTRIHRHLT